MRLSDLFTWPYFGQDALALRDYQDDEQAFAAVKRFFMAIDGTSPILLFISLVIPIVTSLFYHFAFNNKPGRHFRRHYRPRFLLIFWGASSLVTLIFSWVFEIIKVSLPPVDNNFSVFLFEVSLGAMCFGMFVYIVTSLVIGMTGKTNAYPLHKLFSKR